MRHRPRTTAAIFAAVITLALMLAPPVFAQEVEPAAADICVGPDGVITQCPDSGFPTADAVARQLAELNERLADLQAEQEAVQEVVEQAAYDQRLILGPAPRVGVTLGGTAAEFDGHLEPTLVTLFADMPFAFTDKRAYLSVGGSVDVVSVDPPGRTREREIVPHVAVNYRLTERLTVGGGAGPDIGAGDSESRLALVGSGSYLVQPGWGMIGRLSRAGSEPADGVEGKRSDDWLIQGGIYLTW